MRSWALVFAVLVGGCATWDPSVQVRPREQPELTVNVVYASGQPFDRPVVSLEAIAVRGVRTGATARWVPPGGMVRVKALPAGQYLLRVETTPDHRPLAPLTLTLDGVEGRAVFVVLEGFPVERPCSGNCLGLTYEPVTTAGADPYRGESRSRVDARFLRIETWPQLGQSSSLSSSPGRRVR